MALKGNAVKTFSLRKPSANSIELSATNATTRNDHGKTLNRNRPEITSGARCPD